MQNNAEYQLRNEGAMHIKRFMLWPRMWNDFEEQQRLEWQIFKFGDDIIDQIPPDMGVYAFLVRPRIANNLEVSYLMYIGQTTRSLRKRFQEYLREQVYDLGRIHIIDMIRPYKEDHLYFACAVIDDKEMCEVVEDELIASYLPPNNKRLPAKVRRIITSDY